MILIVVGGDYPHPEWWGGYQDGVVYAPKDKKSCKKYQRKFSRFSYTLYMTIFLLDK